MLLKYCLYTRCSLHVVTVTGIYTSSIGEDNSNASKPEPESEPSRSIRSRSFEPEEEIEKDLKQKKARKSTAKLDNMDVDKVGKPSRSVSLTPCRNLRLRW